MKSMKIIFLLVKSVDKPQITEEKPVYLHFATVCGFKLSKKKQYDDNALCIFTMNFWRYYDCHRKVVLNIISDKITSRLLYLS